MSDQTSTLLIKLLSTGDLSALTRGKEQSEALKVSLEGLKGVLELFGASLTLGALVEGSKAMVEYGAGLKHLSEQAGITTDAFQALSYAAAGVGVKQEELGTALNVLNRNMAQAADGATKQNKAIADLGLNTAELLALPVEKQIEEIAKAYVNATDKTKAWADVVALLGRNSARTRELLKEIGEQGLEAVGGGLKISDADIDRLDQKEKFWAKLWLDIKAISASAVARPGDALNSLGNAVGGVPGSVPMFMSQGQGVAAGHGEGQGSTTEIAAQLQATIQAAPQMIAAHQALTKALRDEQKAYEGPAEAARRLRDEANADMAQADELAKDKFDANSQLEAVKMQTEAAKLRAQANLEDSRAAREKEQHAAKLTELYSQLTQTELHGATFSDQIAQAKQHEVELAHQLDALDGKSLTHDKDEERILGEILRVKGEIMSLEERAAQVALEQMVRDQELQNRSEAIALAGIEHDFNKDDTQKWEDKRAILEKAVNEQEQYIANMKRIADDANQPDSARRKAQTAADQGANVLQGTRDGLNSQGPDPHSYIQNLAADIARLKSQWGTLQQNMASGLTGTINAGWQSLSANLTKVLTGMESLSDATRQVAVDIGTTLVQAFVDMGVKWLAQKTMQLAFGTTAKATDTATTIAAAEASSLAWAVPAMLASIASFGAADLAGMAGYTAAVTEAAAIGVAGFESGGFTGGREGEFAGMVHGQEFVWSAPAVRNIGAGNLERVHQAALNGGGVSAPGGGGGGNITLINAYSAEDVARAQRSYVGAQIIRAGGRVRGQRVAL